MFRNYFNNTNDDENGTENWSYPAGFERFNSANIPRSRLGKRRTINPSAEVKRSILNSMPSDNKSDNKNEFKNFASKTSSLTHPVNSFSTPNYKKIDNSLPRNSDENSENIVCNINIGHLTPFRNVGSYPLQEVNNFLNENNKLLSIEKSNNIACSLQHQEQDQQQSDVRKILNKCFEPEKSTNSIGECSQLYSFSSNNIEAMHCDSSNSDMCNNSSFMTAQDVCNFEKNRSYHGYLKTPCKGYGLFDMVASPLDSLLTHTDDDNDSLRKFLVKTPALGRYDPLLTPYRSQMRHDLYSPLKSKNIASGNDKHLDSVPEKITEYEGIESNDQDCISRLEDGLRTECSIDSARKLSSEVNDIKNPIDSSLGIGMNLTTSTTMDSYDNEAGNELKNPLSSVEKLVKRQIFEGIGWTKPHAPFTFQSPIKETPSKIVKRSSDLDNKLKQPIACKTEAEIRRDILHEPLIQNNSNVECITLQKAAEHSNKNSSIIDERISFKVEESSLRFLNVSQEQKKNDLPIQEEMTVINNLSSSSAHTSKIAKTIFNDTNISAPNSKYSFTDEIKESSLKNSLPNEKECTVVMCPLQLQTKEMSEKLEGNDTVIVKLSNPPKMVESKPVIERQVVEKKQLCSAQQCFGNETSLFGYQRQILRPPQDNVIYVNKKPYTVLSMLGRGGSSEVYQVLEGNSSKLMALKFVNLSSVEDTVAKGYLNEIEVLSKLQGCPSVIKMFDNEYISENKILYVLMEKGDIDFSRLMKDIAKTKKISMAMIIYYWTEMLNAVKDIHDKGIIHSDLKPANFLLVSGRLKLIDFGIASSLQGDMTSVLKDVTTGTFNYMSPEAIRNSGEMRGYKINYKSDIWSLGCILYNLLYGKTPFSHLTHTWTKLQAIADPDTAVTFPAVSTAPPHLLLSVRWALAKDPKERPTAEELLKLAELTPGPETQLGRKISSLLGEYILEMFPNCQVRFEVENHKDKKKANNLLC